MNNRWMTEAFASIGVEANTVSANGITSEGYYTFNYTSDGRRVHTPAGDPLLTRHKWKWGQWNRILDARRADMGDVDAIARVLGR